MLEKLIKKYYKSNPYIGFHEISKIFGISVIKIIYILFKNKIVIVKECQYSNNIFWLYPRKNIKIKYNFHGKLGEWRKEIYRDGLLRISSDNTGELIKYKYHKGRLIKKEFNYGYYIKYRYYPNTNKIMLERTSSGEYFWYPNIG